MLVACEESQAVCKEFRRLGHEAYSCDVLPAGGGHPEWHIQADALEVAKMEWDMMVAFPPCTHLSSSGARWFPEKRRTGKQQMGLGFFLALWTQDHIPRIAIENPVGIMSTELGEPTQIIQPWMFGHPETKATCLWLKGLPQLTPTKDVSEEMAALTEAERSRIHYMSPGPERSRLRSRTYAGVAKAMARQWGGRA